jgi:hypothetical protein
MDTKTFKCKNHSNQGSHGSRNFKKWGQNYIINKNINSYIYHLSIL